MVTIVLSVGQSKIGAGVLDGAGHVVCQVAEVATPAGLRARHQAIVGQIGRMINEVDGGPRGEEGGGLGLRLRVRLGKREGEKGGVRRVGISYPEMMEPPARLIDNPGLLTGAPNPYHDEIAWLLQEQLGVHIEVELLHDAAAAVLGEVSPRGTLPGCRDCVFIVWGTGVASGVVRDGSLYWYDPVIRMMMGEIGLQVIRQVDGSYVYRPSPGLPDLDEGELRLDRWLRGPELMRRFRQRIDEDSQGRSLAALVGRGVEDLDLVDINRAAREGNALAIALIESAGWEMGRALVPFVYYWLVEREMAFIRRIVIGSGVAKLGDGLVRNDGQGILIGAIREGLGEGLRELGVEGYDWGGVVLSRIGYEREFFGFL